MGLEHFASRVLATRDSPATVDVILMATKFVFANNVLRRVRRFRNIDKA
jgi:hypothetical protein